MNLTVVIIILLILLSPIGVGIVLDMMDSDEGNLLEDFLLKDNKSITGEESKNLYEDTKCKDSKTNIPKDE